MVAGEGNTRPGLQAATTTIPDQTHTLTLFQRVSVEGLVQLLSVVHRAEPHSCWCQDSHTTSPPFPSIPATLFTLPDLPCPVTIPSRHLYKVLRMRCQKGHDHCCQVRGSQLRRGELGHPWGGVMWGHNNTAKLGHLRRLVLSLADTLTPQGSHVVQVVLLQRPPNMLGAMPTALDVPTLIMSQAKHKVITVPKTPKKLTQTSQLLMVLQAATQYLLNQKHKGTHLKSSEADDITGKIDIINTVNELLGTETVGYLLGQMGQRRKRSTTFQDNSLGSLKDKDTDKTAILSSVDSLLETGELAIHYSELGWFSQVVEAAMDGSLFVGLMLVTLLAAGTLLTTALPFITDSCIICALIGYANVANKFHDVV